MLFAAIAAMHIEILAKVRKKNEDDYLSFRVQAVWGIINYHLEVPFIRFLDEKVQVKQEQTDNFPVGDNRKGGLEKISIEMIMDKLEKARILLKYTDHLTAWVRKTLTHVKITAWDWRTTVGTGDAAWTAMATGFFWSAQTALLGGISQIMRFLAVPRMQVEPEYNQTLFTTEWSCIAKIRFGYAILAGLHLLVRIRKVKGGVTAWQNILFKA
ncbi:hypothetical protein GCM10010916_01090 [Paenibacillus abyssi]|uniref:DUF2953 domain-containing protein n=1 Tax=Paenibacillus abyssi TaxID=1340531 RepID=A0A917FK59_9BACL|nr:hypothetical protein GCM10010916_01090 [Paenibacillus abyssi]